MGVQLTYAWRDCLVHDNLCSDSSAFVWYNMPLAFYVGMVVANNGGWVIRYIVNCMLGKLTNKR